MLCEWDLVLLDMCRPSSEWSPLDTFVLTRGPRDFGRMPDHVFSVSSSIVAKTAE